jgi:predicted O-methyltransferase YrrM
MILQEGLFRSKKYLKYLLTSGNAHSLHSPFVFQLYKNVICDTTPFYSFEKIEDLRAKMLLSKTEILVQDFGTGASKVDERKLSVAYIASHFVKPKKYAQLLFRLVNYFKPKNILEIGTSLGITTLYLSFPDHLSKVISLEGSKETSKIAKLNFQLANAKNIEVITGEFSETLPQAINKCRRLDFVYFDGNHRKQPTLEYFHQSLAAHHEDSVFVFDDIYWSREMAEAWQEIKLHKSVTLTIDLYSFGIVLFRKGVKQHFILRY